MLIDVEDEKPNEIQAEEAKLDDLVQDASGNDIPETYRGKSLSEVIKMHQDAQTMIGKQAQEVGEVRKLADELIKQTLPSKQQSHNVEVEPEIDFFENPQKAVQRTVDSHPDVIAARQATQEFKRMQVQQKLSTEHPDYGQIAQDPEFVNWIKSSPIRLGLYVKADSEFDFDSANELISTYKTIKGVKAKQTEQTGETVRKQNMAAAGVDVGGSGESSRKVYRRADLIRLKMTDPQRYESLSDEIMAAYAEGRVK